MSDTEPFSASGEWTPPGPIRYTATMTYVENGRVVMSDEAQAALLELEQRVTAKLQSALPKWDLPDNPLAAWPLASDIEPLPDDVPQFPREQWAIQPARRAHALILADRLINDGKLTEAGWLVYYGGKMRIS